MALPLSRYQKSLIPTTFGIRGRRPVKVVAATDEGYDQYHGFESNTFYTSLIIDPLKDFEYRAKIRVTSASHTISWGLINGAAWSNGIFLYNTGNIRYGYCKKAGAQTSTSEAPKFVTDQWYILKIISTPSIVHFYVDDNEVGLGVSNYIPIVLIGVYMKLHGGTAEQEYSWVRYT